MPVPQPGARTVRFDDAVALDCSRRLDELADRFDAVARIDRDGIAACTAHWRGASRTWFDHANEATLARLRTAAAQARQAAEALRRNVLVAAAMQRDLDDAARRAAAADLARFEALAASRGRP